MLRSVLVGVALCAVGCRDESESPKAQPMKVELPKLDVMAALRGGDAGADGEVARKSTGAFDFELVRRGGGYVMRDAAYEVTFPMEPTIDLKTTATADGKTLQFVTALAGNDEVFYDLVVSPIPSDSIYNVQKGLDSSRDGMLKESGAKLLSETPTKLAGLDGRHILAALPDGEKTIYLDVRMAWDSRHRSVVNVGAGSHDKELRPAARAFVESLVIHETGKSPLDPPEPAVGVATPTDALDLELVRQSDGYVVRDEAFEITFPSRPNIKGGTASEMPFAQASMYAREVEYFALMVVTIPEHTPYDGAKGLKGAQDGMLKSSFSDHPRLTESKGKVGGLDGRRFHASGTIQGKASLLDGELVWDTKHRAMIGAITATTEAGMTAAGRVFLDSLVIHPKGKPPHASASK